MDLVLIFILGLVFGSFVNVLVWRLPRGESIGGRSRCPRCKKQISCFDNIPLFSYLILKGRCRDCKEKISLRYPLIELAVAIGFLLIGWDLPLLALFVISITVFAIDLKHQIIPDSLVFFGLALYTIYDIQYTNLLAGFLSASTLLLIHLATRGRGMGLGDVKFAVLGGIVVGLKNSFNWLFIAFLTGGVVALILIMAKKAGLKSKIAFGPFLVIALWYLIFLQKMNLKVWPSFF
ncbi:MAG: prepilin peptidase [Patescibacteria group bacterium]